MASDYQRGASAMQKLAAQLVLDKQGGLGSVNLAQAIASIPLPADPANSKGADEKLATMAFELRSEIARIQNARDAEIATLRAALERISLMSEAYEHDLFSATRYATETLAKLKAPPHHERQRTKATKGRGKTI